ncbi:MAG: hypothetical protein ACYCV0_12875 [Desulfitobacteriaceae bacterium]
MAQYTTGLIENTAVLGVRPSTNLVVRITNDGLLGDTVLINGFFASGVGKTQYVQELLSIAPGAVVTRNYYAQFDAFEFQFTTTLTSVEISVWGKDELGNLTAAHRALPAELNLFV